jgi:hypothetical protein
MSTGMITVASNLDEIFRNYPDLQKMAIATALNRTSFIQAAYTLRHTMVFPISVPPSIKYRFDFTSVNKSVDSGVLQALEPTIPFTLPADITFLTQAPSITKRTDGKLEVVREWSQIDKDLWIYESL